MTPTNENGRWSNADEECILLSESDPGWPARFAAEAGLLREILPVRVLGRIVHVGSTAIPGLVAKPVIDMALVPGPEYRRNVVVEALEAHGYVYWAENPRRDRVFLVKGMPVRTEAHAPRPRSNGGRCARHGPVSRFPDRKSGARG